MLSYFTCGQRGNWSDSWYCNSTYDRLYKLQNRATDQALRERTVKRMQQLLYVDAPYLVTVYNKIGEAYRSDRWTGFVSQPDPGGVLLFQYGHANYLNVRPVTAGDEATGGSSAGDGIHSGAVLAIGVAGLVLFLGGGMIGGWAGYRKATVDYRE